jgi:hypothetical protein
MPAIEISCVEVWREISIILTGRSPRFARKNGEDFGACAHCTAVLEGTRNVVGLVGDGTLFQMPQGFNKRLYDKIRELPPNVPRE